MHIQLLEKAFQLKIASHVIAHVCLLLCPCGNGYVGKTSRQLKVRLSEHKSSIRRKAHKSPVAKHFDDFTHNIHSLRCVGIEKVLVGRRGGDINKKLLQR